MQNVDRLLLWLWIEKSTFPHFLRKAIIWHQTGKRGTPGFDVHLFEKQYELVDMVLREAARQVQVGCHERGSVLEKLRVRYNEFFAAMKTLLFKLQQNYSLASADVKVDLLTYSCIPASTLCVTKGLG